MKKRYHTSPAFLGLAAVAVAALIGFSGLGCEQNEAADGPFGDAAALTGAGLDEGTGCSGFVAGLTIEEIDARVQLTEDQREPMQAALSRLQAERNERHQQRGDRHGGKGHFGGHRGGPSGAKKPGEPPMQAFLVECADILTLEQFAELAEFLGERREQMMAQRAEGDGPGWGDRRGGGPGMGGHHGEEPGLGHGGFLEGIADQLGLTDAQREQAQEILEAQREQIRAIHEQVREGSLAREQAREQIREIREAGREQIEQILTEEQRQQWEALHQERRGERIDANIERLEDRLLRRASFLEKVLQLNAEQASQLNGLFTESIAARAAILNQVKDGTLEHEDAMTQIEELEEQLAASISALLTPEQLQVWEALRELHPMRGGRPH